MKNIKILFLILLPLLFACGGKRKITNTYSDQYVCVGTSNVFIIPPKGFYSEEEAGLFSDQLSSSITAENVTDDQIKEAGVKDIFEYATFMAETDVVDTDYPKVKKEKYKINKRDITLLHYCTEDSSHQMMFLIGKDANLYFIITASLEKDEEVEDWERPDSINIGQIKTSLLTFVHIKDIDVRQISWMKFDFSMDKTPFQLMSIREHLLLFTKGEPFSSMGGEKLVIYQTLEISDEDWDRQMVKITTDSTFIEKNQKTTVTDSMITIEYEDDLGELNEDSGTHETLKDMIASKKCMTLIRKNKYLIVIALESFEKSYEENMGYLKQVIASIKKKGS